jgi:hypothetical protein
MEGMEERQSLQIPIGRPRGTSSKIGSYSEERASTGLSSWEDLQEGEATRLPEKKRKRDMEKSPFSKHSNEDVIWIPAPPLKIGSYSEESPSTGLSSWEDLQEGEVTRLPEKKRKRDMEKSLFSKHSNEDVIWIPAPPLKQEGLYEELKTSIKDDDHLTFLNSLTKITPPLILPEKERLSLIKESFKTGNKIFITEILISKNFQIPPFNYKAKPNILSFMIKKKFKPVLSHFLKREEDFQIKNFHLAFKEEGFIKGDETLTEFLLALDDKIYGKSPKKSALNIPDGFYTLLEHAVSATGHYTKKYTLSERISLIKRLISLERVDINKRSRKRISHPVGDLVELYELLRDQQDKKLVLETMETFILSPKMEKTALFRHGNAVRPIISFFIQKGFYDMGRKLIGKKFSLNIGKGIVPFPLRTVEDFKMLHNLLKAGATLKRETFKKMLCRREICSLDMDTLEEYGKSNFSEFYIPPTPSIKIKKERGENTLKIKKWENLIDAAFTYPAPSPLPISMPLEEK